jgi:hypothetical protein
MITIERAAATGTDTLTHRWHAIPAEIRHRLNAKRRQRGLAPIVVEARQIAATRPAPKEPGVYIDKRSPLANLIGGRDAGHGLLEPLAIRVLIPLTLGRARGHLIGKALDERIDRRAFGTIEQLNRIPPPLVLGHDGPPLSVRRGITICDSPEGPVLEWLPDLGCRDHRDVVERIGRREITGASVLMQIDEARRMQLPEPTSVVLRARLLHVAIMPPGSRPAYAGATCLVHRGARSEVGRREGIAAAIAQAHLEARRHAAA